MYYSILRYALAILLNHVLLNRDNVLIYYYMHTRSSHDRGSRNNDRKALAPPPRPASTRIALQKTALMATVAFFYAIFCRGAFVSF